VVLPAGGFVEAEADVVAVVPLDVDPDEHAAAMTATTATSATAGVRRLRRPAGRVTGAVEGDEVLMAVF